MNLFTTILYYLFLLVQLLVALYVLVPLFSLVGYGIAKLFSAKPPAERKPVVVDRNMEFAVIITAHQEAEFVLPLVDSILKQSYDGFQVYVVADDCDTRQLTFSDPRITVLEPQPALHAKIKSIHYALDHLERKHDAVIILDSDNLLHPRFLAVMNDYFRKGYKVVQCDFKPKNTDSVFARMDAIGDMFNFFIERQSRAWMGLSSAIWGSGVAVDLDLYREVKYSSMLGGFDKKLQAHLVTSVPRIAFAEEAVLYDEKISSGKSLETQRTRWINAYFKYFADSWAIFFTGLKKFNLNLMYFGFSVMRPPLFIVLGAAFLFTAINFFIDPLHFKIWAGVLLSFLLSFITIVLIKGRSAKYLGALCMIPVFAFRQAMALLKLGKARKSFLKTQHTKLIYIDELLKQE